MDQSNEIRDRPLLWAARRPFVAPVSVPVVKAPEPKPFKGFQLVGLFGNGDSVGVIVSLKGKTQRMRPGETFGEWKLKSVGANDAVFSSGSQEETLVLKALASIVMRLLIRVKRSEHALFLTLKKFSQWDLICFEL